MAATMTKAEAITKLQHLQADADAMIEAFGWEGLSGEVFLDVSEVYNNNTILQKTLALQRNGPTLPAIKGRYSRAIKARARAGSRGEYRTKGAHKRKQNEVLEIERAAGIKSAKRSKTVGEGPTATSSIAIQQSPMPAPASPMPSSSNAYPLTAPANDINGNINEIQQNDPPVYATSVGSSLPSNATAGLSAVSESLLDSLMTLCGASAATPTAAVIEGCVSVMRNHASMLMWAGWDKLQGLDLVEVSLVYSDDEILRTIGKSKPEGDLLTVVQDRKAEGIKMLAASTGWTLEKTEALIETCRATFQKWAAIADATLPDSVEAVAADSTAAQAMVDSAIAPATVPPPPAKSMAPMPRSTVPRSMVPRFTVSHPTVSRPTVPRFTLPSLPTSRFGEALTPVQGFFSAGPSHPKVYYRQLDGALTLVGFISHRGEFRHAPVEMPVYNPVHGQQVQVQKREALKVIKAPTKVSVPTSFNRLVALPGNSDRYWHVVGFPHTK